MKSFSQGDSFFSSILSFMSTRYGRPGNETRGSEGGRLVNAGEAIVLVAAQDGFQHHELSELGKLAIIILLDLRLRGSAAQVSLEVRREQGMSSLGAVDEVLG